MPAFTSKASDLVASGPALQIAVGPSRELITTSVAPVKFIQRRRLLHASHLIETTSNSIEAVAARVGYQDGTALRKLLKREFGMTLAALHG